MDRKAHGEELSDHLVIFNASPRVRPVVRQVRSGDPGMRMVLLLQDAGLWEDNPGWHPDPMPEGAFTTIAGCAAEAFVLERAGLRKARAALVLADPLHREMADARSALLAVAIERHSPHVHTVVELLKTAHATHVRRTEVNEVISFGEISERLIAQSCITPGSSRLMAHLLSTDPATSQILFVDLTEDMVGLSYRAIVERSIEKALPLVVCGFVLGSGDASGTQPATGENETGGRRRGRRIVMNPDDGVEPGKDTVLQGVDRLIVISPDPPRLHE